MNKKTAIQILLNNPLSVLKDGIRGQYENHHRRMVSTAYDLEQLPTIDLLDLFPDLAENLSTYSFLEGTSLVTDLVLLKSLARSFEKCSYLEIGSWRGESIANVAEVAADCTSLTLSEKEMYDLGYGREFSSVHGLFSKGMDNVTTIEHNSRTFDFTKLGKEFDLIFIDGDHSYEGVLNDSRSVFPLRKNDRSIIVWHDYGLDTENVRHSVLHGILDGIPRKEHKHLFHISNTMCAVFMPSKQFNTQFTRFPSRPNKKFSIEITAQRF